MIPPTNATAFYGSSPNATEEQINTLQTWLQANPTVAGKLNLPSESNASDETGRKALGGAGNVGTEKRKWKGNPLYTFANGVVVGKNNKLIAGIGTSGANVGVIGVLSESVVSGVVSVRRVNCGRASVLEVEVVGAAGGAGGAGGA